MKGPRASMSDLFWWGGFIGGVCVAVLVVRQLGVTNRWVELIAGLVVGVGLGYTLEKIHSGSKPPPPPDF